MIQAANQNRIARLRPTGDSRETDPLQTSVPLAFHRVLFPLGFPTSIKSNEPSVIRAAEESWGAFHQKVHFAPIEVRLVISDVLSRRRPSIPSFRAQSNLLMLVADKDNFGCCDLATGFGFASLTKAATTHRDYLRYHFLEAMVYTLLDTQRMRTIHAACVEFQGHGVLLLGESGAGKSSLAYAATRRGWTYLCDDGTSLILHKTGRTVVGNPQTIRFRPSALTLFPEIKGRSKVRNGKPTIEIRTELLHQFKITHESTVDLLVFLNRSETTIPRARTVSSQDVFRRLSKDAFPVELSVNEERSRAVERLLSADAIELDYQDFNLALDLLESVIRGNKS
jgi:hypothetical protein